MALAGVFLLFLSFVFIQLVALGRLENSVENKGLKCLAIIRVRAENLEGHQVFIITKPPILSRELIGHGERERK